VKETISKLLEEIQDFEKEGLYEKAQSFREKLLILLPNSEEKDFSMAANFLAKEKITILGVEVATQIEPFYLTLFSQIEKRFGAGNVNTALAKRKLAKIYYIQSRIREAISLVEQSWSIFSMKLGKNSDDAIEAVHALMAWHNETDSVEKKKFCNWLCKQYPFCEHLQPLENYLIAKNLKIERDLHFSGNVDLWVDAWLNLDSIQEKLKLNPCVEKFERNDERSYSDRGFICSIHQHLIRGYLEQNPKWSTVG
jgi:tetratricopeptide (TPR) repeat protein